MAAMAYAGAPTIDVPDIVNLRLDEFLYATIRNAPSEIQWAALYRGDQRVRLLTVPTYVGGYNHFHILQLALRRPQQLAVGSYVLRFKFAELEALRHVVFFDSRTKGDGPKQPRGLGLARRGAPAYAGYNVDVEGMIRAPGDGPGRRVEEGPRGFGPLGAAPDPMDEAMGALPPAHQPFTAPPQPVGI